VELDKEDILDTASRTGLHRSEDNVVAGS